MKRWLGAAAAVVLAAGAAPATAAAACSPTASPDPAIPTWQAVNGYALGSREATDQEIEKYMAMVDGASTRVRTGVAGRSVQGRPLPYAIAGTPANVAPGRLAAISSRLRAVRAGTASLPRGKSPAFAWVAGSVHGNEPSGADADMRLLYELAAGRDCVARERLSRLVTILLPVQNPDGRAANSRFNGAGFDLNRDWFARTQPETDAKIALLRRYPPILFVDQHEHGAGAFFFPPNADPIHHEVPNGALSAIADVFGPALRRAFDAAGLPHVSSGTYDLFFMGFGDSVPTTLFGAAGMTFEKGSDAPYQERVDQHHLAAATALTAAARHEPGLLRGWAREWRAAREQGARGHLQPNRAIMPGGSVSFQVPTRRVYGYAIRADVHAADAVVLARRLASAGVRVDRLRAPLRTKALRGFGETATAAATLPAGTFYVSMAQTAKHWIEAMLGDDAYVPIPYTYDVSSWSNPLLMGLAGGALQARVGKPAVERFKPGSPISQPAGAAAPAYGFPGGAEGSLDLAFALLKAGAAVSRRPTDGGFVVSRPTDVAALKAAAAARNVGLSALDAAPGDAVALRLPRVALLPGASPVSAAWSRHLLERRLGLAVDVLDANAIAAGRLAAGGYTALVATAGAGGALSAPAALALGAWVRSGGELVGVRRQGVDVARAAGLTAVTAIPAPEGFKVAGAALRVTLDPADPVAWGEAGESYTFVVDDPILDAHGARVVARYPANGRFHVSGYSNGADVLRGTAAATDELVGAGRVVLFAFDPAFRGYVESTERLVGNALLAPPGAA